MNKNLEVFLQGIGIPKPILIEVSPQSNIHDILILAKENGLKLDDENSQLIWVDEQEEPLQPDLSIADAEIKHRSRIHIHSCRKIHVTVNFQNHSEQHPFSPSETIQSITLWAIKKFKISDLDASEYSLQLCNSTNRPDPELQIGTLTQPGQCQVCFDLVPKEQIEG